MIQTLPGFRDFYPADCAARNYVFDRWREVARRYGFVEYDGPTLESVELYRKKSGGELLGQLFDFKDKGEREVALRPEMTPTLARMIAARDRDYRKPLKWFSIAPFFRYEKQQKGRLREFYQLNCDLIGEASPAADAEMIALAIDLLRACGLTRDDFFVRVNDRQVWLDFLAARGVGADRAAEFLQIVDKLERERPEVTAAKLAQFGVAPAELNEFLARPAARLGGALGSLEADLHARGLADFVTFDPRIVRGLAYYTGVVFEVFDRARQSRALAGGGRYDELIGLLSDGSVKHPALGFAVGDVTLLDLLRALPHTAALLDAAVKSAAAAEIYVVVADEQFRPQALGLAGQLRAAGRRVDFPLTAQKVGKQFQAAEASGASHAVVVGAEWPQVKYKHLGTREEEVIDERALRERVARPVATRAGEVRA
jgi:histidyl-tRNA synthetase